MLPVVVACCSCLLLLCVTWRCLILCCLLSLCVAILVCWFLVLFGTVDGCRLLSYVWHGVSSLCFCLCGRCLWLLSLVVGWCVLLVVVVCRMLCVVCCVLFVVVYC